MTPSAMLKLAQAPPSRAKLPGLANGSKRRLRPPTVLVLRHAHAVAAEFGVQPADLFTDRRGGAVTRARWEMWRRLHVEDGYGFAPIGHACGSDHTSVLYAERKNWGRADA